MVGNISAIVNSETYDIDRYSVLNAQAEIIEYVQ